MGESDTKFAVVTVAVPPHTLKMFQKYEVEPPSIAIGQTLMAMSVDGLRRWRVTNVIVYAEDSVCQLWLEPLGSTAEA